MTGFVPVRGNSPIAPRTGEHIADTEQAEVLGKLHLGHSRSPPPSMYFGCEHSHTISGTQPPIRLSSGHANDAANTLQSCATEMCGVRLGASPRSAPRRGYAVFRAVTPL